MRRANLAVAMLIVCQGVITLGLMVLVPIMPFYLHGLSGGSSADAARWTSIALAAPGVGALLCAPYAVRWCERFGYRRALLFALALFVVSMTTMAISRDVVMFVGGRLLQGASTVGVIITAFITRVSDPAAQGRSLGWQESAVAAGALAGPVLGGVLQDHWSVRPLLLGVALCTGAALLLLAFALREPSQRNAERVGAAETPGTTLLADPVLLRWVLAGALTQAGAFALVNVFALFVDERMAGASFLASKIGVLHALGWAATLIAGPWWGARNDRGDPARHFVAAALSCAIVLALMPFASRLWQIGVLRIVQGASYAALAQSVLLLCCRSVPSAMRSRITVVSKSAMVLGQLLGPIAVLVFLPCVGASATLWLTASMFIAAAVVARSAPAAHPISVSDSR